jgi:hypothetical protein
MKLKETNLQLFWGTNEICQLFYLAAKMSLRIPKWGLPFLYILYLESYSEKKPRKLQLL